MVLIVEYENIAHTITKLSALLTSLVAGRAGSLFDGHSGCVLLGGRALHGAADCIDGGFLHIDDIENMIVLSTLKPKRDCMFTILVFG